LLALARRYHAAMKPQHIVATILRILSIVWLVYALTRVHSIFAYAASDSRISVNVSVIVLVTILQLVACAVLWFFPMTLAAKLVPCGVPDEPNAEPPRLVEWQTLGVICIGLWGVIDSIPSLVFWATFATLNLGDDFHGGFTSHEKATVVSAVVEFALSLWLVFGAKGFAAFLFRIRMGGVAK
jgi:hypothetical protein